MFQFFQNNFSRDQTLYALTSAGSEVVLKPEPERRASADPKGGGEGSGPPLENHTSPGKSQVIWDSTGNRQFDPPPPPGKSLTPPPPWKMSCPPPEP